MRVQFLPSKPPLKKADGRSCWSSVMAWNFAEPGGHGLVGHLGGWLTNLNPKPFNCLKRGTWPAYATPGPLWFSSRCSASAARIGHSEETINLRVQQSPVSKRFHAACSDMFCQQTGSLVLLLHLGAALYPFTRVDLSNGNQRENTMVSRHPQYLHPSRL